jgi:hypothetical protein
MSYQDFLKKKEFSIIDAGFNYDGWMPESIFPFQRDLVKWALKRGRAALFCDTGLGKTIMQLTWAYAVQDHNNKPVLIVAPLCVAQQTVREGKKFGIDVEYIREPKFTNSRIHIINYEMLKNFNPANYCGIVLDESSILKGMDGKFRAFCTEFASTVPYRLSCTATPSPNDFMELGTQSEFLGIMSQTEMLAMFFIHDGEDTSKWRLKGHGKRKFWEWLATWSCVIRSPADLGYDATGYDLPPIEYHEHIIETEPCTGLFVDVAQGLQERNKARKESVQDRVKIAVDTIKNDIGQNPVVVWCNMNEESALLAKHLPQLVEVCGADTREHKEKAATDFTELNAQGIISKPSIYGFGLNWQHCNHMVFVGLSDSWEKYYQAIRRCYRFGQKKTVHVHIISADTEGGVVANIKRKEKQNRELSEQMVSLMREFMEKEIKGCVIEKASYQPSQVIKLPSFLRATK